MSGQLVSRVARRGVMRVTLAVASGCLVLAVVQQWTGLAVIALAVMVLAVWGDLTVGRGALTEVVTELGRTQRELAATQVDLTARATAESDARWALTGVMHGGRPWPQPGGWALDSVALMAWLRQLELHDCRTLVELGPGMSTLVMARALPHLQIHAVEHSERWAAQLRSELADEGFAQVEVVLAPLERTEDGAWYSHSALAQLPAAVDALLVDGPPNWKGNGRRRPAETLIRERLLPGAVILVDDTARPDERAMIDAWVSSGLCEIARDAGTFTILRRCEDSPGAASPDRR